ncbi:MAG: glycosyltransferase family 39 protein, partial [Chloroflexota bacterium]
MTHRRIEYGILGTIVVGYLLVGVLYALQTPAWQAPDEPAHYNYIAQVAEGGCCPVIAMGDWDNAYLEELKAARFDPALTADIAAIEYEDHQPPLYYLGGAVIYALSPEQARLTALRMYSVLLGAVTVIFSYLVARQMFPQRADIALSTAALVAFIPQHVAILASVNNDALAVLLVAVTLFVATWGLDGKL